MTDRTLPRPGTSLQRASARAEVSDARYEIRNTRRNHQRARQDACDRRAWIVIRAGHVIRGLLLVPTKRAIAERDRVEPLDVCHAVPARDDKAQRKPVLRSQGLAVHLVRDENVVTTRLGQAQAALVLLLDTSLHASIEACEHDLDGIGERPGCFEQCSEGRPGPLCIADRLEKPRLADRTW